MHITFGAGQYGELQGHLCFHPGDDSAFRAVRRPTSARQRKTTR